MKDIIASSFDLDVNRHILISNAAEKKIFDCVVRAIEYYLPIRPLNHVESIFFLLVGLNLLVRLSTDLKCTKSKSYSKIGNINNGVNIGNRVDNEIS